MFWGPSWLKCINFTDNDNKPIIYDAASFVCSLSMACVCEILKTTVITYSHKGIAIPWLIIKAGVNSFNRLINHTINGGKIFYCV